MSAINTNLLGENYAAAVQREVERYAFACPNCEEWHERDDPFRRGEIILCECGKQIEVINEI